jgi:hypothetical protein
MTKTAAFLSAGLLGVLTLLSGLAVDSYLHAKDPGLIHREGLFTLTNPGHLLLGTGIGLVVLGVVGAAYIALPYGVWVRRGLLAGSLALIFISGDVAAWAASVEWSGAGTKSATAAHAHSSSTGLSRPPTAAELQAATKLMVDTRAAVARYADEKVAIAAGYEPVEPMDLPVVHFVNSAYLTNADVLRPEHVQSLIYYNTKRGPVLIGAMYMMPSLGDAGPEIGGPLTSWHHHDNLCFDKATGKIVAFAHSGTADVSDKDKSGVCPKGSSNHSTPEMLHVWVVDNPNGPFDADMDPDALKALISNA